MPKTKKYIEVADDSTVYVCADYLIDYSHGEDCMVVELPDMSHYRRRSPSEKPETDVRERLVCVVLAVP